MKIRLTWYDLLCFSNLLDSYTFIPNKSEPGRQAKKLIIDRRANAIRVERAYTLSLTFQPLL